jgi:hypothetical protein
MEAVSSSKKLVPTYQFHGVISQKTEICIRLPCAMNRKQRVSLYISIFSSELNGNVDPKFVTAEM